MCPIWPGKPMTAHWGVPDPAAFVGPEAETRAVFLQTYRMLLRRIGVFINLPLASLDSLSLQKRLQVIGADANQPAKNGA
jgi:arsenate reductase